MNRLGLDRAKPSLTSRPVGRAKSCTRCRQAKLACDARKTLNGPCSRCRSKDLECRFDANFKRVSTRKLTEEISHELHALRSTEEALHARLPTLDPAANLQPIPDYGTSTMPAEPALRESDQPEHASSWLGTRDSDLSCSYSLGTLKLEAQIVVELFQYFEENYHPHVLFLQPVTSFSGLLSRSPLLFWTIILVASQEQDCYTDVYHEIANEHEGLLSPILGTAIQRIETIHALLLLCLWPIPQSQHFQNPSWNYTGLAIHAAMQLHCHSPLELGEEQDGWSGFALAAKGDVNTVDLAQTWLGCFQVGNAVAIFSGLPPPISTQQHLKSIDKALSIASHVLPSWYNALLSVLKIQTSAMDAVSSIEDHTLHFLATQMFTEQLDKLKQANVDVWRSELEMAWCNAKLYLFALTFTTPATADPSRHTQLWVHRHTILQKAFETSASLVTQFVKLSRQCASDLNPGGLGRYVPELYFTSLFNATTVLFRFMATFMTLQPVQESQAMELIIEAHKIFQSYPEHREHTRAAIHIETFIDILKQAAPIGASELVVKNKLGASIMFDSIFRACRQRNIDPKTGRPLPVQEWRTVNETFAERLPGAPAQRMGNHFQALDLGINGLEVDQDFAAPTRQNSKWWEQWDAYIDLFHVEEGSLDLSV